MRRMLVASFLGVVLSASSLYAADQEGTAAMVPVLSLAAANTPLIPASLNVMPRMPVRARRPMVLPALYVGSAALQAYDAFSTLSVLKAGGTEANPLMKHVTKSPVAFVALKAGMTTMSVMAAERMWKNHNRMGAILTMAGSNALMAVVAANNARVLGRVR